MSNPIEHKGKLRYSPFGWPLVPERCDDVSCWCNRRRGREAGENIAAQQQACANPINQQRRSMDSAGHCHSCGGMLFVGMGHYCPERPQCNCHSCTQARSGLKFPDELHSLRHANREFSAKYSELMQELAQVTNDYKTKWQGEHTPRAQWEAGHVAGQLQERELSDKKVLAERERCLRIVEYHKNLWASEPARAVSDAIYLGIRSGK